MNTYMVYRNRDEKLKALGYESYQAYLSSKRWAWIRGRVLKRDKGKCVVCGAKATQVHHRSYTKAGLLGLCLDAMRAVCAGCHKAAEMDGTRKTHITEANRLIPSVFNICPHCRRNPTKKGQSLCGKCKRERT